MKRTQKITIVVLLGVSLLLVGTWVQQVFAEGDRWTDGARWTVGGSAVGGR